MFQKNWKAVIGIDERMMKNWVNDQKYFNDDADPSILKYYKVLLYRKKFDQERQALSSSLAISNQPSPNCQFFH